MLFTDEPPPQAVSHLADWFRHRWPLATAVIIVLGCVIFKGFPILKDYLETRRTVLDIKKTRLEVEKLEEERSPIHLAGMEEIRKYDPKIIRLEKYPPERQTKIFEEPLVVFNLLLCLLIVLIAALIMH